MHMLKEVANGTATAKCGATSKKPTNKKFNGVTGWHTDVTCNDCIPQDLTRGTPQELDL